MIKRIYIDNFRCMVNFEVTLGPMNLFLGHNGTGKSSVFDVIWRLKSFLAGDGSVASLFEASSLTKWDRRRVQSFEIDIEGNGGSYRYILSVKLPDDKSRPRVEREALFFDGQPLFLFEQDLVNLFSDDFAAGPQFPADWSRSVMAGVLPRGDNTKLTWFKEEMDRLLVVRINPFSMATESAGAVSSPEMDMGNFVSWLLHFHLEQPEGYGKLIEALRGPLPGFRRFQFPQAGDVHRILKLLYSSELNQAAKLEYRIGDLSDGQRTLLVLYTLLHCSLAGGATVCIDEPDNFLALPEIQPWLLELCDMCVESAGQVLVISHHPELINFLASDSGLWFSREGQGPVRLARVTDDGESGLRLSELVARGWLHAT